MQRERNDSSRDQCRLNSLLRYGFCTTVTEMEREKA